MGIWWMIRDLEKLYLAIDIAGAGVLMSENSFIRALKTVTNFLLFLHKILKIKKGELL